MPNCFKAGNLCLKKTRICEDQVADTVSKMIDPEELLFADWSRIKACPESISLRQAADYALVLRRLLLDQLIHVVNRKHKKTLRFPALDFAAVEKIGFKKDEKWGGISFSVADCDFQEGMTLDEFLSSEALQVNGEPLSIKNTIKLLANKLGGVHYDPLGGAEFGIPTITQSELDGIVSRIKPICKACAMGIWGLAKSSSVLPSREYIISHWGPEDGSFRFEENQFLKAELSSLEAISELTVAGVFEFRPISDAERVVLSIRGKGGFWFEVGYTYQGTVFCRAQLAMLSVTAECQEDWSLRAIGKRIALRATVCFANKHMHIVLNVMGHTRKTKVVCPINSVKIINAGLGARYDGTHGARFLMWDCLLLNTSDISVLRKLNRHFYLHYQLDQNY